MWVLFVYMCHFLCVQALRCVYLCEYICVCWSMWVCDCVFVCSRLGECEGVIVQTRAFVLGLCAPRECGFGCLSMYTWFACVCVCVRARWSISVTGVQQLLLQSAARELTACPPPISTSSDITRVAGHPPRGSVYTAAGNDAAGQSWPSARHLPH